MVDQLLYNEGGSMPRGEEYLKCNYVALRPQSQLGLQSRIVFSSRLVNPLFYPKGNA
jgi:hypothetical protein